MEVKLNTAETAYIVNGREYPRVTARFAKYFNSKNFKQEHLDRGTAVHKLAEWTLRGLEYPKALHPELHGYKKAMELFLSENVFVWEAAELFVWSRLYQVAGTLDCLGAIRGKPVILDLKSGKASKPPATTNLQTAIYRQCYEENTKDKGRKRYGLQVRPDGTYGLINYDKTSVAFQHDLNIYVSMLNVKRWEKEKGYG